MKEYLDNGQIRLYPSDFRYSAAIVGLVRYFKEMGCSYVMTDEYIEYAESVVLDQEKYLLFAEKFFRERMHHCKLEDLLAKEELTEQDLKEVGEKLSGNTIMKKIFANYKKYSPENKGRILDLITENRLEIIENTFRLSNAMYRKFANEGRLFTTDNMFCRLQGYDIDKARKSKSISFFGDTSTFVSQDEIEFDYIPFAFTKNRESYFICNNFSIKMLVSSNDNLANALLALSDIDNERKFQKRYLFFQDRKTGEYINYDAEVMVKSQDEDYYRTLYIRKESMDIMSAVGDNEYRSIMTSLKVTDKYYINVEDIAVNAIINLLHLDPLIERILKFGSYNNFTLSTLIKINCLIYGGEEMDKKIYFARQAALDTRAKLGKDADNKLRSYRHKLISAITFKDYDRFCQTLLKLSDQSGVVFTFAYDLFDDFEINKNIAYAFINGLNDTFNQNNGGEK